MAKCDECGQYENMPYQCRRCGRTFCAEHRLPENHHCPGLGDWNDPGGVFDSGFDDSVSGGSGGGGGVASRVKSRVGRETGTGGFLGFFRGNVTYLFLGLMWVTFLFETLIYPAFLGIPVYSPAWDATFLLTSANVEYVWTWITSVFSHAPEGLLHIGGNSIALYFFGPLVERYLGSKRYAVMFLVTGAVAGLAQVGTGLLLGDPVNGVLGASGAIMAIMGFLSVVNPNLRVMLLIPPIPLKIRTLTALYAGASLLGVVSAGSLLGNVAHAAHLSGLVLGIAYASVADGRRNVPNRIGNRGGPGSGRGGF